MQQAPFSWKSGFLDAVMGRKPTCTGGLDRLAYAAGRVEGEAAQRKQPMFGTLEHLTDWIAQQPSDRTFPAAAGIGCLYCQYGNAYGRIASYDEVVRELDFGWEIRDHIVAEPRTFGAALERARAST